MTDLPVSIRLNPFKRPQGELPILSGARPVPWCIHGRILAQRPVFTLHPLFHAGCYYVQDSSAMFVGHRFRELLPEKPERLRVLDLCAAPGGKTTDIAASLRERCGGGFLLVSNEVMKQRARVLDDNVARWGDPNVIVTSADPAAFASLKGYFDIIVADVPCSGEGMFRKDEKAVRDWSEETVRLCTARQRRILADVWPALRQGGLLIYSTCTYEDSENDGNLQWAAGELGGEIIVPEPEFGEYGVKVTGCGHILRAGDVPGEGQWVGALRKTSPTPGGHLPDSAIGKLHPLRNGVVPGPEQDWALSLDFDSSQWPSVEVDKQTALHFLHRDTLSLPHAPAGYIVLTYRGIPLGFVKNIGSRCNNLLPKGRRIMMDIQL